MRRSHHEALPWLLGAVGLVAPALALGLIAEDAYRWVAPEPDSGIVLAETARYDLDQIHHDGTLVVALPSNTTSYLLYRGTPRGFEYEILESFAMSQDVTLEVRRIPALSERLRALYAGEVDIVGGRMSPAGLPDPRLAWSTPLYSDTASVVQRNAPPAARFDEDILDDISAPEPPVARWPEAPIESTEDLAGRTVWSRSATGHPRQLEALSEAIGEEIEIVRVSPARPAEALVRWVATGQADVSMTYSDLAEMRAAVFENIEIHPIIGDPQPIAFATRDTAPDLLDALDIWLYENADTVERLYQRYFIDRRSLGRVPVSPLDELTSQLSPFDDLFQEYGEDHDIDWLLLASVAYQESRFQPRARSWAGAAGLMQLMPGTAHELGVSDRHDPEQSIDGAVRYLTQLDERLEPDIPSAAERIRFVLASYNAGLGHVYDAQRLTDAEGGDPERWEDVAWWLLQLSRPDVYATREEVRHGYCRGIEPVLYVDQIMSRYAHYQQFYSEAL